MSPYKSKRFKLVIFDWDGTLVNSTARIVDSMQSAGREHNMRPVPDSAVQHIIGLGLPEALKTVWPEITPEQLPVMTQSYARNFVTDSAVGMDFFPGVREFLEGLKISGYELAVATGKTRKGLDRMMKDLHVGHLFSATRCADETRSKPDPLMLHELLSELNVQAEDAVMIGDTAWDLNMANSAGVAGVGMSYGAHDEARLRECNPLTICHSIRDLNDWISLHG